MSRGGKRSGAGRPKGKINQAKRDLQELASEHTEEAVETLVAIMRDPEEPGKTRAVAANAILDRAHGKPPQAHVIGGDSENPIIIQKVYEPPRD